MPHFRSCRRAALLSALAALTFASPAVAQEEGEESSRRGPPPGIDLSNSVFDDNWVSLGVGVAINPSYTGSDDYVFNVLPVVQGSLLGVDISPRAAGVRLDFIPDPDEGVGFDLGLATRIRNNRADQIEDEVVLQYGELDGAFEVGPSVGINIPALLIPVDSLNLRVDTLFDVTGAHGGMAVEPSISYSTPLSLGAFASLSFSAEWADEDFHDYYFRVDPAQFTGEGPSPLAAFEPDGGGFNSVGTSLLVGYDLNNNALDGGLGLVGILGYSRLLGDAANTPFTSVRGSRDQFIAVVGLAYTF